MRRLRISMQPISITRSPSLAFRPVVSVSRTICLAVNGDSLVRQPVGSFVLHVAGVAFHPMPLDLMQRRELVQASPQVDVLDRLPVSGAPAAALPGSHPLGDALLHVLRVRV